MFLVYYFADHKVDKVMLIQTGMQIQTVILIRIGMQTRTGTVTTRTTRKFRRSFSVMIITRIVINSTWPTNNTCSASSSRRTRLPATPHISTTTHTQAQTQPDLMAWIIDLTLDNTHNQTLGSGYRHLAHSAV